MPSSVGRHLRQRLDGSFSVPMPNAGLQADRNPRTVDPNGLWDVQNFLYQDKGLRVRPGFVKHSTTMSSRVMGLVQYDHEEEELRLVAGHVTGWAVYNRATQAWDDITEAENALTGGTNAQQVFRVFVQGGVTYIVGTNGADVPKKWAGTKTGEVWDSYADIGGTPPVSRCMAVAHERIILGNCVGYGHDALVCSANQDMNSGWDSALQVRLSDTPGAIIALLERGNLMLDVFKEDAIYSGIARVTPAPFEFEMRKANIPGPVSPLSVVPLPNGNCAWLANDSSVQVYDGSVLEPFGGPQEWHRIQKAVLRTIDTNRKDRAWGAFNSEQGLLLFAYPQRDTQDISGGILIDIANGSVWPVKWANRFMSCGGRYHSTIDLLIKDLVEVYASYTNTWAEFTSEAPVLMLADSTGQVYRESGTEDDGDNIEARLTTGLMDFGDVMPFKTVVEADHLFLVTEGAQAVDVELGVSDYGEEPVFQAPVSIDLGSPEPKQTGHRLTGRMFALRLSLATKLLVNWLGTMLSVVERGRR